MEHHEFTPERVGGKPVGVLCDICGSRLGHPIHHKRFLLSDALVRRRLDTTLTPDFRLDAAAGP